jgi:predicted dehydrogenase
LADTGPHLFDLFLWILGTQRAEVNCCKDDNLGGIEANALIKLAVGDASQSLTGRIEMSFTRQLRNTMKFYGERGCLEAETVGANEVFFYPPGQSDDPLTLRPQSPKRRKKNEEFSIQLSNFVDSIINGSKKYIPADEAIATMALVEECYRSRTPIAQPWEMKHLETFFGE